MKFNYSSNPHTTFDEDGNEIPLQMESAEIKAGGQTNEQTAIYLKSLIRLHSECINYAVSNLESAGIKDPHKVIMPLLHFNSEIEEDIKILLFGAHKYFKQKENFKNRNKVRPTKAAGGGAPCH